MRILASSCLLVLLSFQWGWSQPAISPTTLAVAPAVKAAPAVVNPKVRIETSLGGFTLELNPEKAPITVKNFLSYVDQGFYSGTVFHRVIRGFMIQGGGFTENMQKKPTQAAIKLEAGNGLSNQRGTVAMARTNVRDSATSQFFVNVVNNRNLDKMGGGYAVFGKVIEGLDVVDKIRNTATANKGRYQNVPVTTVVIKSAKRL
jgi:peptidyl-prolyl cis-trans isomerase A (cyclophilin A)